MSPDGRTRPRASLSATRPCRCATAFTAPTAQALGVPSSAVRGRVRAVVPQSELHLYATELHSITHGRGNVARRFRGYEQMPHEAAQRVIEEAARAQSELATV